MGCGVPSVDTGPVEIVETPEQPGASCGPAPCLPALPAGMELTVPRSNGDEGVLVSHGANGLGVRATWAFEADLVDVAAGIVEAYRDKGTFELAHSGYLDLLGSAWGCVVVSQEGWVELVVVKRGQPNDFDVLPADEKGGFACVVTVARLGQGEVGR